MADHARPKSIDHVQLLAGWLARGAPSSAENESRRAHNSRTKSEFVRVNPSRIRIPRSKCTIRGNLTVCYTLVPVLVIWHTGASVRVLQILGMHARLFSRVSDENHNRAMFAYTQAETYNIGQHNLSVFVPYKLWLIASWYPDAALASCLLNVLWLLPISLMTL